MSFLGGAPPQPAPMVPPPIPAAPAQMTQPTSAKPQRKPAAPSFIGAALTPQNLGARSLVGGAPAGRLGG